jgi:hypothetical protein
VQVGVGMCMGVGVPTVNRPSAEDNIHTGVCARACTYHATPGHRTGTAQGRRLTVSPVSADPSDRISNINLKCQWVLGVVVLFVGGWGYVMWATVRYANSKGCHTAASCITVLVCVMSITANIEVCQDWSYWPARLAVNNR